jgi:hypothetical protein
MNPPEARRIFLQMTAAWDMQNEDEIEAAISMMLAYWMQMNEGTLTLEKIADQASHLYITDYYDLPQIHISQSVH